MTKDKLTGRVSYRLAGQVFRQIERLAAAQDLSVNEWCRQAALEKLKNESPPSLRAATSNQTPRTEQSPGLSRGEQILLEEILRIRFLIHFGGQAQFGSSFGLTAEAWKSLTDQVGGGPRFKEVAKRWLEFYGLVIPPRA
jgi:hypothetical protein